MKWRLEHRWSTTQSAKMKDNPTGRGDIKSGCGSAREAGTLLSEAATGETPIALGDFPLPQALEHASGCRVTCLCTLIPPPHFVVQLLQKAGLHIFTLSGPDSGRYLAFPHCSFCDLLYPGLWCFLTVPIF